ncbi:uncharacterized protein LOC136086872 [Hydra vulgaris]|uniref:Uncharacterized protein LOC136086872 n=1 Tax=Hydra vulgaris TaxID=6087 RepID=A0ABM4CU17_HYDVU
MGLVADFPKKDGSGTNNNGNTSRRAFAIYEQTVEILDDSSDEVLGNNLLNKCPDPNFVSKRKLLEKFSLGFGPYLLNWCKSFLSYRTQRVLIGEYISSWKIVTSEGSLLYKSLVHLHLEYGAAVWSPFWKKDIDNLELVQHRATRIKSLRGKLYEERIKILELPTLHDRRRRVDLIQMVSSLCDIKSLYRKLLLVCKYFATTPWSYVAQNGTSTVAVMKVENLKKAVEAIKQGEISLNEAAYEFCIPKATLSRHINEKNKVAVANVKFHGRLTTLPNEIETELADHCLLLESMYFGLRIDDLRRLAFDIAEANNITQNFNKQTRMARKKWYYAFMQRHPQLSLRGPESTSIARAQGFNKERVQSFFNLLSKLYMEEKLTPDRLYNMDETSLSTVQDGQIKIISARGKKRVGIMTSSERGNSVTAVVCVSAAGFLCSTNVNILTQKNEARNNKWCTSRNCI